MSPATEEWTGPVADGDGPLPTLSSVERYRGKVWGIVSDTVDFGSTVAVRDVVVHPGAVAIIALDDRERVLLIRQYRHPVAQYLFEPPAGLLDKADEPALATAVRELAEEAGFAAGSWATLCDAFLTPGGSTEAIRVFLARDVTALPDGREHTGEAEEAHLPRAWVDLDEAKDLVLAGRIGSPTAVIGVLAAWTSRAGGWASLRPADAPWSVRDRLLAEGRVFTFQNGA